MDKYLSKLCVGLTPYVAGEQPQDKQYIKLNTNENPYPPCSGVADVLRAMDTDKLKKYSDPNNSALKAAIAEVYGISTDNIFLGNGSDEVLAMCYPAFANTTVAFADITYSFYPVYCDLYSMTPVILPLNADFSYNIDLYKAVQADMLIVTNPNAPTTLAMSRADLITVIESNLDKVVVIDEAYSAFMGWSAVELVQCYDNIVVVKTFSKSYSLAGARCGYAIASPHLIGGLDTVKNSFNSYTVNTMTEAVAVAAMKDQSYLAACTDKIIATREWTALQLAKLGFTMPKSSANFLFCTHESQCASVLYASLKARGVLVRYFNKPLIDNYLRITIGSREEMEQFVAIIREIIYG